MSERIGEKKIARSERDRRNYLQNKRKQKNSDDKSMRCGGFCMDRHVQIG